MSATQERGWWVGLRCHHCGRVVKASDRTGGASFHKPLTRPAWAEHHDCKKAQR